MRWSSAAWLVGALGIAVAGLGCGSAQKARSGDEAVTGTLPRTEAPFDKEDPARARACGSDADCTAGALCHPGEKKCTTTYPAPRVVEVGKSGDSCKLVPIYFAFDSADVIPEARPWVTYDAHCLSVKKASRIVLASHADARGEHEYNIELSRRRGEAVKALLEHEGVSLPVEVLPRGERDPLIRGSSERAFAYDRRVEIELR